MATPDPNKALEERRKYVQAYNATMVKIWREQIVKLGVVDTGALYRSIAAVRMNADGKFTQITLEQSFNLYGIYVDFGTGSNTWRGNGGDIGRDNPRKAKRWFSLKHYRSVMNIREFWTRNISEDAVNIISNALTRDLTRSFAT